MRICRCAIGACGPVFLSVCIFFLPFLFHSLIVFFVFFVFFCFLSAGYGTFLGIIACAALAGVRTDGQWTSGRLGLTEGSLMVVGFRHLPPGGVLLCLYSHSRERDRRGRQ